jgi:hypothetical protein
MLVCVRRNHTRWMRRVGGSSRSLDITVRLRCQSKLRSSSAFPSPLSRPAPLSYSPHPLVFLHSYLLPLLCSTFAYMPFKGKIALKKPQCEIGVFEEYRFDWNGAICRREAEAAAAEGGEALAKEDLRVIEDREKYQHMRAVWMGRKVRLFPSLSTLQVELTMSATDLRHSTPPHRRLRPEKARLHRNDLDGVGGVLAHGEPGIGGAGEVGVRSVRRNGVDAVHGGWVRSVDVRKRYRRKANTRKEYVSSALFLLDYY